MAQLPPESATATALRLRPSIGETVERDTESEQWSRDQQLLAGVRDELHYLRHAYTVVHSGKTKVQWKPEPLPRPGVAPSRPGRAVVSDAQAELLWRHLQSTQPE